MYICIYIYIYIYSPTWYNIRDISLLPLLNSLRRQCREIMMIIHVHNWHKQPAPYEMTLGYSWDTKCSYIKNGIRHDLTVKHMGMFTRYTWYSIYSVSICGMIICTMCTLIDQSYIYIYIINHEKLAMVNYGGVTCLWIDRLWACHNPEPIVNAHFAWFIGVAVSW